MIYVFLDVFFHLRSDCCILSYRIGTWTCSCVIHEHIFMCLRENLTIARGRSVQQGDKSWQWRVNLNSIMSFTTLSIIQWGRPCKEAVLSPSINILRVSAWKWHSERWKKAPRNERVARAGAVSRWKVIRCFRWGHQPGFLPFMYVSAVRCHEIKLLSNVNWFTEEC